MLTTFENIDRYHRRREERERHLQEMEAFARGLEFPDEAREFPMVETVAADRGSDGSFLLFKYFPRLSRRLTWIILATLLGLVATVFVLGLDIGQNEISNGASTYGIGYATEYRRDEVLSLIVEWKMTDLRDLENLDTPAARAFEWLLYSSAELDVDALKTRYALATFYFAMHGVKSDIEWSLDQHWLSMYPVCLWHGVECSEEIDNTFESVKALNLSSNELAGTIPQEVGLLGPQLKLLDISKNKVAGTIPSSIGHLRGLEHLYLGPNKLSSSIPTELGDLRDLEYLFLNECNLNGTIPAEFGKLSSLRAIALDNNGLTGSIPSAVFNLDRLAFAYFDNNRLHGSLPDNLGRATNLVDLRLSANMLSGTIPSSIGKLRVLEICYVDRNRLSDNLTDHNIFSLHLLKELHLYSNDFFGALPSSMKQMPLLRTLYLDNNHFSGTIPSELVQLLHLESLFLDRNRFVGQIPSSFSMSPRLAKLRLNDNSLTGSIPSHIGQLRVLDLLQIHDNLLTGTIPIEIGELTSLKTLTAHGNKLVGHVPISVCALASFQLDNITMDCASSSPQIECNCCTGCF